MKRTLNALVFTSVGLVVCILCGQIIFLVFSPEHSLAVIIVSQCVLLLLLFNYIFFNPVVFKSLIYRIFKNSKKKFIEVLRHSPVILSLCDKELRYTWSFNSSKNCSQMHCIGKTDIDLLPNEAGAELMELKREVIKTGNKCRRKITMRCNGELFTFDFLLHPILNKNNEVDSVASIALDLSALKQFESNGKRRQMVLESIYTIATTFGSKRELMYDQLTQTISSTLNVSKVSISRLVKERLVVLSEYIGGTVSAADSDSSNCATCRTISCSAKMPVQLRGKLSELYPSMGCVKRNCYNSYIGIPIVNCSGDVSGAICVLDSKERTFSRHDIWLLGTFARYVAHEFERDSIQKELMLSREMKVLGQLTSGVAHEVRNPLNAIWAITEALFQELGDDTRYHQYKEHIGAQVERLTRLMQDLLDFGKPFDLSDAPLISPPDICEKTVLLWNQINSRHATRVVITNNCTQRDLCIKGDETKIQQVIMNLLDNASHHSSEDSTIDLVLCNQSDKMIRIQIQDRGEGVAKENLNHIFDPFFTTRKNGNGLGLSIVKNIIEFHGGTIELWNNKDSAGVTVEICLPVVLKKCTPESYEIITDSQHRTEKQPA